MGSDVGRIRAALPQFLLQQVDAFEPELRDGILESVSSEAIDAIRSKLPIGWLDMTLHMEFVEHVASVVEPEAYVALWERSGRAFLERPMLGGLLGMAKRLFMQNPHEAIRYLPRMYPMGVDGLGELSVDDLSDHAFSIKLRGFPAARWNFDNYVLGLAGVTQGACPIMFPTWPLEVGVGEVDRDAGAVDYRLTVRPESSDASP